MLLRHPDPECSPDFPTETRSALLQVRAITLLFCGLLALGVSWTVNAQTESIPSRIGVLLPLSGKFAPAGLEVKRGIDLALSLLPATAGGPLSALYRDTQDDPALTALAVHQLVTQENVVAIVGPLVSATVDAAANSAADLGVPLIVLSQKAGIPHLGRFAFRNFLTPEQQIRSLVAYSMEQLKLLRFAVVYPEQKYGMDLAALFWDEVTRRGGSITGTESYPQGTTDFMNLARRTGGKFYTEVRRKELQKLEREASQAQSAGGKKPGARPELPPIADFDAIFIPDQHRVASAIAAALAHTEMSIGKFRVHRDQTPIRLLGISSWNTPDLVLQGGEYLEDSIFVDNFFAGFADPRTQAFVTGFHQASQKQPGALSAAGYDAIGLLHSHLEQRILTRFELLQSLVRGPPFAGATGSIAFDEQGELKKDFMVISVQKKKLVLLSPADIIPTPPGQSVPGNRHDPRRNRVQSNATW